ncbi:NAD(P)-dependent oxidoreductase [Candidatus Saccharibacteria bacterium]|nr:NAD(P)-dependent oxidoreductase [Candidatus Saccharibacteria bacterium]
MGSVIEQDVKTIVNELGLDWKDFADKTILVTGATGLVGSLLVRTFLSLNKEKGANIKVIILVRSSAKAKELFEDDGRSELIVYEQKDITEPVNIKEDIDYIIHTAAPASSRYFVEEPVETMDAIINGSRQMLELAKEKKVEKIVLMSSMEAYGVYDSKDATENEHGYLDLCNVRNSYSVGKRAAELCAYAYYSEYGVPTISVRLAMCFGAGQKKTDTRVHRIFCEAAIKGEDVVVKSTGKSTVNFVYSSDAILAILLLLLKGKSGETYNVAGDDMDYTIMDMANFIASKNGVKVKNEINESNVRFAKDSIMRLNTDKIKELGWAPKYNIEDALMHYMDYLKEE